MLPLLHAPAPTLSGAPCLSSSLQPLDTLWDTGLLMVAGCPENHGEATMSHRGQLHRVLAEGRWCVSGWCGGRGMMVLD